MSITLGKLLALQTQSEIVSFLVTVFVHDQTFSGNLLAIKINQSRNTKLP